MDDVSYSTGAMMGFLPTNPLIIPIQIALFVILTLVFIFVLGVGVGKGLLLAYIGQGLIITVAAAKVISFASKKMSIG